MKNELEKSIVNTFEKSIKIICDICETEIEKIFLMKLINYVIKRHHSYGFSFIFNNVDTEIKDGVEYLNASDVNYQAPDTFGFLSGLRIHDLYKNIFIEVIPQKKIQFHDASVNTINYRLDFAFYKYAYDRPDEIVKSFCIECDGFDFHSSKNQIKKDNERTRNLLLYNGYTTIRYLGTEIYNMEEDEIGFILFNL